MDGIAGYYEVLPGPGRVVMWWGHQWNRVVERTRAGRAWSATQRAAWVSSSSSMEAKCRFTSTVLVSGHRCSAGCSSGE
jgi:hypothetical protein